MKRPLVGLCALHLLGNAVLLGLGYWWLSVGESSMANLALSAVLLAVFLSGAAWLHGTSLAFFREAPAPGLRPAAMRSLRSLLPLVALAVAAGAIYFGLAAWQPLNSSRAADLASYLTLKLQSPVRPAAIQRGFAVAWWVALWALAPAFLLPAASGVAARGWVGFLEAGAQLRNWRYWVAMPALLSAAGWAPLQLIRWKPLRGAFGAEMASAIARFGAGYLLFAGGCLLLAFITSRGRPSFSQPSTAVSP